MSAAYHIRYLQRQEIDIVKWDACMERDPEGLIYCRSFYLDHMASGQWGGLVLDDYAAVMPIPWKKKFGFCYIYQPYYLPFLGVFGSHPAGISLSSFLRAIPQKFKYWDIDLTETSRPENNITGLPLKIIMRLNNLLPLQKDKEEIARDYKRLATRMCKKAIERDILIVRDGSPLEVIERYRAEYGSRHTRVKAGNYEAFTACALSAFKMGNAATYLAKLPDGETGAWYLVFRDNKFVYSIMGGSTEEGKEKGAFYLLTDAAIKDHAGSNRVFRFEGSDIPGIAFFNEQFGPARVQYPHLIMNNLPFPVNLLKSKHSLNSLE
ncbi:hypothetical protein ACX0G9_10365 [Flavitalea flava]